MTAPDDTRRVLLRLCAGAALAALPIGAAAQQRLRAPAERQKQGKLRLKNGAPNSDDDGSAV